MKNYEQMAEDVLRRAEAYRLRQKRNRRIVAGAAIAVGCLCLVLAAGIGGTREREDDIFLAEPPTQVTASTGVTEGSTAVSDNHSVTYGFTLLAAYTAQDEGKPLEENLVLPLNYSLRVRDLRGLSKAETDTAVEQERQWVREAETQSGTFLGSCKRQETYVISLIRTGCFRLQIHDYSFVETVSVESTTQYGMIDFSLSDGTFPKGQKVILTPEDIPETDRSKWLVVNWKYSNAVLDALDADPSTPLSEFSDTVIFTVNYTDGTKQQCAVEICIEDDGQILVCLLGKD